MKILIFDWHNFIKKYSYVGNLYDINKDEIIGAVIPRLINNISRILQNISPDIVFVCSDIGINKRAKAIYADYHDKGFDVLGVSLDNNLEAWKKAIKDDGIVWGQVSDLKGWESPMPELYNFSGIPHLVLVDGEGRIVAKNLRGEALRAKVAEICK